MNKPENNTIEYCGYSNPKSKFEIEFEILGLKNLIKKAEMMISVLEQRSCLAKELELSKKELVAGLEDDYEEIKEK